jgi:hypothetical protein
MSDGLIAASTHEPLDAPPDPAGRPAWFAAVLQGAVVVAVFAVVSALCGLLWYRLWDVPHGVVSGHEWFTSETGLRADFAGTGLYVAIAALAGVVLGALAAWLCDRSELVTLAAVLLGSVLAAYVMLRVGYHLSPPDPDHLALTAKDGTKLDGAMRVNSWPPRGAFPFGALVGLALVYGSTVGRAPTEIRTAAPDDSGLADGTRG